MYHAVEPFPLLVVVKYDIAYRGPVQGSIGLEHPIRAEMLDDEVKAGCTWFDHFTSEYVGVNDGYVMFG